MKKRVITLSAIVMVIVFIILSFFLTKQQKNTDDINYGFGTKTLLTQTEEEISKISTGTKNSDGTITYTYENSFGNFEKGEYLITYKKNKIINSYFNIQNVLVVENGAYTETEYIYDKDKVREQMSEISNKIQKTANDLNLTFVAQYVVTEESDSKIYTSYISIDNFMEDFYNIDTKNAIRFITFVYEDENKYQYVFTFSKLSLSEFDLLINPDLDTILEN